MGSIKRKNEDWIKLLEQQRMSGKTLKAWCEANSINLSTMAVSVKGIHTYTCG